MKPSLATCTRIATRLVALKALHGKATCTTIIEDDDGTPFTQSIPLQAALRLQQGVKPPNPIIVDKSNCVIRNASVATIGPALGHGFSLDMTSIEQIADCIAAAGANGVPVHFKHGEMETVKGPDGLPVQTMGDRLGTLLGVVKNARVVGRSCLGDIYLGNYANRLPGLTGAGDYLLALADENPADFGLSAVFNFEVDAKLDGDGAVVPVARIENVESVDFVGAPAANPAGLAGMARARPRHRVALDPRRRFYDYHGVIHAAEQQGAYVLDVEGEKRPGLCVEHNIDGIARCFVVSMRDTIRRVAADLRRTGYVEVV